jgi:tellurite resistance protein|nr:SLAC1 anion channel family protein [uncultured Tolumonas sp.]
MNTKQADHKIANDHNRLLHFPVSFFSVVMGLSGLSIAWKSAGQTLYPSAVLWLGLFSSLVMIIITVIYCFKVLRHTKAVITELHHPIRLNFFPAFSISLLLLSVVWGEYNAVSFGLWSTGAIVQISLTLYVMSSWIHHTHYTLSHANPSWFIPVVGNIIVPISGVHFGYAELSWFFFSIGIVFWLVLLTIVLYRLFFHEPLPARMTPMLFILLAPPSVGFVSYTGLSGALDPFGRILYYIALFLGMLLFSNVIRFIRVPFYISSWAYSFPLAALTIATAKMSHLMTNSFFSFLATGLLLLLSILVFWLVLRTGKAIWTGELCRPE